MLSGEGNENGENATIGLISKKVHFFGQFFVVVLHDYNDKLPGYCGYTFYGGHVLRVFLLLFFFTISSFHPGCR